MVGIIVAMAFTASGGNAVLDLQTAKLVIDGQGYASLQMNGDAAAWPAGNAPVVEFVRGAEIVRPRAVSVNGNTLAADFDDGGVCAFVVRPDNGFVLFELTRLELKGDVKNLRLFSVGLPDGAEVMGTLNAGGVAGNIVAVTAAEPNVHAFTQTSGRTNSDKPGCSHTLTAVGDAKVGTGAALFTATCNAEPLGWSYCGLGLTKYLDVTGI